MFSMMSEVGSLPPPVAMFTEVCLSIKCKNFNVYVNYAGNIMAWNCLLGSLAEFSNEMNYYWHIDPISEHFSYFQNYICSFFIIPT